jgi:hypothetical protein
MTPAFRILVTPRFERLFRKLKRNTATSSNPTAGLS